VGGGEGDVFPLLEFEGVAVFVYGLVGGEFRGDGGEEEGGPEVCYARDSEYLLLMVKRRTQRLFLLPVLRLLDIYSRKMSIYSP
jgi:hypothetical protein